jgi:hypothetical protein
MMVVLIDETNGATTADGSALSPGVLQQIASASTIQLNRDVAGYYGIPGAQVRVGTGADTQPGEIVFALMASLPNAPGAIAYHDVNGHGVPVIFDGLSLSDTLIGSGNSVSIAVTHELCETAGDEGCNVWADDGAGSEWAHELCDAVESSSYSIDVGGGAVVFVSNFVLPAFWIPNHVGPYDYLKLATAPFATSGGYQITRLSGTGETQVQGTVKRAEKRKHWSSRTYRRGARVQ